MYVERMKKQLLFDMLYVEKDKSWNLAAAIWYVKKDKCCWKWRNNWYETAAAIWYVKKDECCYENNLICWEG